jgi:dihydroorotate dehydrogenase
MDALSGGDAERSHYQALFALRVCGLPFVRSLLSSCTFVRNERKVFGITFPNPVGLAAGFDKYGQSLYGIQAFGFGFAEVGTITPLPQPGNPRPRLFRLKEDGAVINRMGFNNDGAEVVARRLAAYRSLHIPIGVNVGKGRDTPLENAADDYAKGISVFYSHADYLTINASSPNTKDLRRLQEKERLQTLLDTVQATISACAKGRTPKPVLLKIAPDVTESELDDILSVAESKVQGLIIGNTTIERPEYLRSPHRVEAGGLSGKPLTKRTPQLVGYAKRALPNMPVVGVGGISNPDDARRMFDAGASLIQLYTGLVFEGPLLAHRINRALLASPQKEAYPIV